MNKIGSKFLIILFVTTVIFICGYGFYEFVDVTCIDYFWSYLNNQSVAVLVAFLLALFGYYVGFEYWKKQHKKELYDQYVREFVDFIIRWYTIKKDQTNYRKKQTVANKRRRNEKDVDIKEELLTEERFCHEQKMNLDGERSKVSGQIDSRYQLLSRMSVAERSNLGVIEKIYKEYHDEFGAYEAKKIGECENPEDYDEINKKWDESYKKILNLVTELKL